MTTICAVCGVCDGSRFCENCTRFYEQTVASDFKYKCWNSEQCEINYEFGEACRYCRFQKCINLKIAEALNLSTATISKVFTTEEWCDIDSDVGEKLIMERLVKLQDCQVAAHTEFFESHEFVDPSVDVKLQQNMYGKNHRRARAHDVNIMLKLALLNGAEWGEQFEVYRALSMDSKRIVLLELGFALMVIDQGFKTQNEATDGFWMIQNGTFMHPDYFLGLPEMDANKPNAIDKAVHHRILVNTLLNNVAVPFKELEIDEFECAVLKTLILLNATLEVCKDEYTLTHLLSQFIIHLLEHCFEKCSRTGTERFGKLVKLLPLIREAIRALHLQTRISEASNFMKFDPYVKDVFCQD